MNNLLNETAVLELARQRRVELTTAARSYRVARALRLRNRNRRRSAADVATNSGYGDSG